MASPQTQANVSGSGFTDLWYDAVTAYQLETKRELALARMQLYLKTPEDLLTHIESQGVNFANFRDRHGKLWSRIYAFAAPVAAIGNAASTVISSVSPFGPPISAVLGAVMYLVTAADKVKDAYDWIQVLFSEFEDIAGRLQQYISPTHGMDPTLQKKVVAILTCLLRLLGRSEALITGGRFREYLKCTFLGKDDKTKGLLDDLNKQVGGEKGLVLALTYAATRKAEDYSKDAAEGTVRIEAQMDRQEEQNMKMEMVEHMKRALTTPALDMNYRLLSAQSRDLVSGTGAWLEKEPLFEDWVVGRLPVLWVFGGPGSGKSFLATWAVLHLRKCLNQTAESFCGTAVAYFFIKDYDVALLDPNNILKTLAFQIAEADVAFREYVSSICTSRESTVIEHVTWTNVFEGFYSSPGATGHRAVLILDGLDEAPQTTRKFFLDISKQILSTSKDVSLRERIQFGVFGRPELRGDLDPMRRDKYIQVSSIKNQDDMKTFINNKIPDLALVKEMTRRGTAGQQQAKKLARTISKQVLQGADGVFLWAKLLMEELEELDLNQMGRALKNPPSSLDEMIRKLFRRISEDEHADLRGISKMLTLICFSQRPLLFGELQLFLSLPGRQPQLLLWRNIRGRFASLFDLKFPLDIDPDSDRQNDHDGDTVEADVSLVDKSFTKQQSDRDKGDIHQGQDDGGDHGEDDDTGSDFDFGDDVEGQLPSEFGAHSTGQNETNEDANTLRNDRGQLMTSVKFTHLRIKDFLLIQGVSRDNVKRDGIQVDPDRGEIELTICCLQALQQGYETQEQRAYLVEYPARNFVLHLENVKEDCLTADDVRIILSGLVQLFHSDQTSKALVVGAGPIDHLNAGRNEFWAMWMSTQRYLQVVQKWLHRPEVETLFSDQKTLAWISQARTSTLSLLEPMVRGAAQMWLAKKSYDDKGYVEGSIWLVDIICAYRMMDQSGQLSSEHQGWSWEPRKCGLVKTSSMLYTLAEWSGLEKTTHWHSGVGDALMTIKQYDEAISEFEEAIRLDPKAWPSMVFKAGCLAWKKRHREAIETMTRAIADLPEPSKSIKPLLFTFISKYKQAISDTTGSYEAALQGFQVDRSNSSAQRRFISVLALENRHQEIVDTLSWMHNCIGEKGCSLLVGFFMLDLDLQAYWDIGSACRRCGNPKFVLEALEESLKWSRRTENTKFVTWRLHCAGVLRYYYYWQNDEAVKVWEEQLDLAYGLPGEDYRRSRTSLVTSLSIVYFDMAVAARQAGQESPRLAAKLKELCVVLASSLETESFQFYHSGYPSLLWGRWLREYETAGTGIWSTPFRTTLLEKMNQLDDDDPENDTDALRALAEGLFHAGDRKNAGAILAIIFHGLEEQIEASEKTSPANVAQSAPTKVDGAVEDLKGTNNEDGAHSGIQKSSSTEVAGNGNGNGNGEIINATSIASLSLEATTAIHGNLAGMQYDNSTTVLEQQGPHIGGRPLKLFIKDKAWLYTCCYCWETTDKVTELYFCEICENTTWCDKCLPLLKDNDGTGLKWRFCNPRHDFYRAWPIPEEARDAAVTWRNSGPELKKEWLDILRQRWL